MCLPDALKNPKCVAKLGPEICPSPCHRTRLRASPAQTSSCYDPAGPAAIGAGPALDHCHRAIFALYPVAARALVGPVAQWLEPAAHNGLVGGSSPSRPTNSFTGLTDSCAHRRNSPCQWGRQTTCGRKKDMGDCFRHERGDGAVKSGHRLFSGVRRSWRALWLRCPRRAPSGCALKVRQASQAHWLRPQPPAS
jgi:hypothetical protein